MPISRAILAVLSALCALCGLAWAVIYLQSVAYYVMAGTLALIEVTVPLLVLTAAVERALSGWREWREDKRRALQGLGRSAGISHGGRGVS